MDAGVNYLEMMTGLSSDGNTEQTPALDVAQSIPMVSDNENAVLPPAESTENQLEDLACLRLTPVDAITESNTSGIDDGHVSDENVEQQYLRSDTFKEAVAAYLEGSNLVQGKAFAFSNPPTKAWWRWTFGINSAAADVLFKVQWWAGRATAMRDGKRYIANSSTWWQVQSGITPKEWRLAKPALGKESLLEFRIFHFARKKATWVRPTDTFFKLFGVTQDTYDQVGSVLRRRKASKYSAQSPAGYDFILSMEEQVAISSWADANGFMPALSRKRE